MQIQLTPDQQALIHEAIASGRLNGPEQAMEEALALWEERERRRLEILAGVEEAKAAIAAGESRLITTREEAERFSRDIQQRGRARFLAEQMQRG